MHSEILAIEPDPVVADLWRYGRVEHHDAPLVSFGLMRLDGGERTVELVAREPATGPSDYPTAALLVRATPERRRFCYDLSVDYTDRARRQPPKSVPPPRSTSGRSRGSGPSLEERARRRRPPGPSSS